MKDTGSKPVKRVIRMKNKEVLDKDGGIRKEGTKTRNTSPDIVSSGSEKSKEVKRTGKNSNCNIVENTRIDGESTVDG